MPVIVQKYGGTSVADVSRIHAVADRIRDTKVSGKDLVVVVSAMGQTTDRLVSLAAEMTSEPPPREMDMLLTAGERITMALLAMALNDRGVEAVSFTGSQAGILTDSSHGDARITKITGERVRDALAEGKVVIIAGFQGVDPQSREITTLGRGGSDTTAVALAAALGAEACEILTDVAGVFSADPRVVPEAQKLDEIGYYDMLTLASAGAAVLMPSSVEIARETGVPVHVRSAFSQGEGTWIVRNDSEEFVAVAASVVDDIGVVTIAGTGASSSVAEMVDRLAAVGIDAVSTIADDRYLRIHVAAEEIDQAVRCIHELLITGEESQ